MRSIRSKSFRTRAVLAALVAGLLALGAPAGAIAQNLNPTDTEYGQEGSGLAGGAPGSGGPQGTQGSPSSGEVSTGSVGKLPFTGLDVAAIAAIGIGLAGGGFVVRRAARAGGHSG